MAPFADLIKMRVPTTAARGLPPDRVDWYLWNWQTQIIRSREAGEGYPSRASGGVECYKSTGDSDRDFELACKEWAAITDVAIDDLETIHGTTIYKRAIYAQLVGGRWDGPEILLGINFREACNLLAPILKSKGLV